MPVLVLFVEFTGLYLFAPLCIVAGVLPKAAIMPALWIVFGYAVYVLRRNGVEVMGRQPGGCEWKRLFHRTGILILLLGLFVALFYPQLLFALLRSDPLVWLAVMFLYPLLSVIPQEVVFRRFFFYRYERVFKGRIGMMLGCNAVIFALVHTVFGNPVAVLLTLAGGALFAWTYHTSRSVMLVSIEHALYGNALYTLGLGGFFYHGSV